MIESLRLFNVLLQPSLASAPEMQVWFGQKIHPKTKRRIRIFASHMPFLQEWQLIISIIYQDEAKQSVYATAKELSEATRLLHEQVNMLCFPKSLFEG